MSELTEKARVFCIAAHEAVQQKRKYTGEPYFTHPCAVAKIIKDSWYTEEMICAAYLHDVVEDANIKIEVIEDIFGPVVASYVFGLTDVSKPSDGNRAARKRIDREHTAQQCPEVKTIKLADLIHNSESILKYDKEFAKVYILEKELLLDVLNGGDKYLWRIARDIVVKAKKEMNNETSD